MVISSQPGLHNRFIINLSTARPVHGNNELHQIYRIIPNYTKLHRITPPNANLNMQKSYILTYILIRHVKIVLSCFLWLTIV